MSKIEGQREVQYIDVSVKNDGTYVFNHTKMSKDEKDRPLDVDRCLAQLDIALACHLRLRNKNEVHIIQDEIEKLKLRRYRLL